MSFIDRHSDTIHHTLRFLFKPIFRFYILFRYRFLPNHHQLHVSLENAQLKISWIDLRRHLAQTNNTLDKIRDECDLGTFIYIAVKETAGCDYIVFSDPEESCNLVLLFLPFGRLAMSCQLEDLEHDSLEFLAILGVMSRWHLKPLKGEGTVFTKYRSDVYNLSKENDQINVEAVFGRQYLKGAVVAYFILTKIIKIKPDDITHRAGVLFDPLPAFLIKLHEFVYSFKKND